MLPCFHVKYEIVTHLRAWQGHGADSPGSYKERIDARKCGFTKGKSCLRKLVTRYDSSGG